MTETYSLSRTGVKNFLILMIGFVGLVDLLVFIE